ncbi:MAG: class I SAM-dependent methyltransferase [Candidatus Aminicenantes bacterium]|nr:class I SAM-dependent methyltransferase [Candidatus Aminicenantes bacterium]
MALNRTFFISKGEKEKIRWEENWSGVSSGHYEDLNWDFKNYAFRLFDEHCQNYLNKKRYTTLLDMGSGDGRWMIYFAKRFGYKVAGIDYSHHACVLCAKNLKLAKVDGEVFTADFLHQEIPGQFDVVYLGGVIEHYQDPLFVLSKALTYLSPGGTLINWIPTSNGLSNFYVRLFDFKQLKRVVPIDGQKMEEWYDILELKKIEIHYNGSFSLNMFPIQKIKTRTPALHDFFIFPVGGMLNKTINELLILLHKYLNFRIEGKLISPFLIAFGIKQEKSDERS